MNKRTPNLVPITNAVDALAIALRTFDPHAISRARSMSDRLRNSMDALRAALQLHEPRATPAQRAQIEARLLPLAKQARDKFTTLANLTSSGP